MGTVPLYPAWREDRGKGGRGPGAGGPHRGDQVPRVLCALRLPRPGQGDQCQPRMLHPLLSWAQGLRGAQLRPGGSRHVCSLPGAPPWMTMGHWPSRKETFWALEAGRTGQKEGPLSWGLVTAPELASGAHLHRCFGNIEGRGRQPGTAVPCFRRQDPGPGHALRVPWFTLPTPAPQSLFCLA